MAIMGRMVDNSQAAEAAVGQIVGNSPVVAVVRTADSIPGVRGRMAHSIPGPAEAAQLAARPLGQMATAVAVAGDQMAGNSLVAPAEADPMRDNHSWDRSGRVVVGLQSPHNGFRDE